jgi:hypothetical protein
MDFNRQLMFDPKIDIIGKEVPIAAMEKTGDILQGRYDAAKDTETKTMALIKKLSASSNSVDRETATQIMEHYGNKMKERAAVGDYQNMKWQTQQDAMDAAGLYEGLSNRNKELMKHAEDINTKSGITDVNRRSYERDKWLNSQSKTKFNSENGVLEGTSVTAPNLYKDVDTAKLFDSYGQGIIANVTGKLNEGERVFQKGEKLPNGETAPAITVYNVNSGRTISTVTPERVRQIVLGDAGKNPEVKAYMEGVEDYYEKSLGMTKKEAQEKAYSDIIETPLQATVSKYAHTSDMRSDKTGIDIAATGYFNANRPDPLKPNTYTPNDIFEEYKTAGKLEFPDLLNSSLQNNKKSKATLLSALDYMVQNGNVNAKKAKEVVKGLSELSEEYPEYADVIRRSTAGQYNSAIGRIGQAMFNVGSHINNLINTGIGRSEDVIKKGQKLVDQYKELARTGIFDSKFENEFEATTNTAPLTRKLAINSVNLESDAVRTAVTKLSNDLNLNKFDILEGEWKSPEDIKVNITGVSKEPYGAGSGIAFELMDSKGNTVIATPKKQAAQGIIGELDKVLPGIKSANNYREMVPLSYFGQQKDFEDIGKEIGNLELGKQFKGYKLVLNKDGTYTRISPNGEKVNSPNPILLLPQM